MNKKLFIISLLVVPSLILSACGGSQPAVPAAANAPAATDAGDSSGDLVGGGSNGLDGNRHPANR